MSGQWETVGKKKEKGNPKVAAPQNTKKKTECLNVKLEDVLAKSQVKNIYSNGKNKENKPVELKKTSDSGPKKAAKKQEKSVEVPKPKSPKTVESALKQINAEEFKNTFENSKSHFPDAPIVWLKDLAHFLNQRLNVETQDPVFSQKPQNFPLIAVPVDIKSVMEQAIQEANKTNIQLFFDITLTSMVTDMSKNLPAIGHKLFLQYIALNEPNLVTANLSKHCVLRNSYQNRPNVGLSILWAVGFAGINNFEAGLTIFQDLMLPLIELKNYSRYVVKYLLDLITSQSEVSLTRDQFLFILEVIFSNKKNFPVDLKQDLVNVITNLKSFLFFASKKESFKNSVDAFLKKLPNENISYQDCLCDVIVEIFRRDPSCIEHWTKIYAKNMPTSAILLQYIDNNWETVSNKVNNKFFIEALKEITTTNAELVKKKKDGGSVIRISEKLLTRMTNKKRSRSTFKLLFIVMCLIAGILLYCDVRQEGRWQDSKTFKFLKKYGVPEYSDSILNWIKQKWLWIDEQIQENCPGFRKAVVDFACPYITLIRNLAQMFFNICVNIKESLEEKYPVILQSIDSYAPGVIEQSQNAVSNAWSSSIFYFNRSIDYLRKEVFVGQLSPDNMQKVVYEAFNATQHKATEYYHWLYEKVQSAIK